MIYLEQLAAEIRQAVPEQAMPQDNAIDLFTIYAVLLLAKGEAVRREDVHNAWVAWMLSKGETGHDSLVPFSDLDPATQAEDSPFVAAIRTVAAQRRRGSIGQES